VVENVYNTNTHKVVIKTRSHKVVKLHKPC